MAYRLYSKGRILGHKRAKRNTRPNTSLLQIEGVATKEDAQFYLGKVRYVFCISFALLTYSLRSGLPTSTRRSARFRARRFG